MQSHEADHVLLHVFYLDRDGAEQRASITFTQTPRLLTERVREALQPLQALVNALGGTLLSVQLELGSEVPGREPAEVVPIASPIPSVWA